MSLTEEAFRQVLLEVVHRVELDLLNGVVKSASDFESLVAKRLSEHPALTSELVSYIPGTQRFPDICIGRYGVEVKFKSNDGWREVANSVFEGSRDEGVEKIFVVFGKLGNVPGVRVKAYEDAIVHVRTSHVPRFSLSMEDGGESLFDPQNTLGFGLAYDEFRLLPDREKMRLVKEYAKRKHPDQWLWWIGDEAEPGHTLPPTVRTYTSLSRQEKSVLRAEAAIVCPEVFAPGKGGQNKQKTASYAKAAIYWLRYHGVFAGNSRDVFSAGSVAGDCKDRNYVRCSLLRIQRELLHALENLDDEVLREYWGHVPTSDQRKSYWLQLADSHADTWVPSAELFKSL
jgi:hypothetical protein